MDTFHCPRVTTDLYKELFLYENCSIYRFTPPKRHVEIQTLRKNIRIREYLFAGCSITHSISLFNTYGSLQSSANCSITRTLRALQRVIINVLLWADDASRRWILCCKGPLPSSCIWDKTSCTKIVCKWHSFQRRHRQAPPVSFSPGPPWFIRGLQSSLGCLWCLFTSSFCHSPALLKTTRPGLISKTFI